jgi:hypothetical protein
MYVCRWKRCLDFTLCRSIGELNPAENKQRLWKKISFHICNTNLQIACRLIIVQFSIKIFSVEHSRTLPCSVYLPVPLLWFLIERHHKNYTFYYISWQGNHTLVRGVLFQYVFFLIFCKFGPKFHKFSGPILMKYSLSICTLLVHPFASHSYLSRSSFGLNCQLFRISWSIWSITSTHGHPRRVLPETFVSYKSFHPQPD